MCSNIGTSKNINFPFGTNGKLIVLDVPILKHFRVLLFLLLLIQEGSCQLLAKVCALSTGSKPAQEKDGYRNNFKYWDR